MSFEKDISALRQALQDTEARIKKLQEHRVSAKKQLGNNNSDSTISRLDRNLEKLEQKRQLILKELQ